MKNLFAYDFTNRTIVANNPYLLGNFLRFHCFGSCENSISFCFHWIAVSITHTLNILSFSANRNSIAETPTAVFQLVNTRFISHSKALLWKFFGRLPQPCDLNESEKINR